MKQNNSDKIDRFKKEEPFDVPKNYFEEFAYRMQLSVETKSSFVDRMFNFLQLRFTLPLSFTLIIAVVAVFIDTENEATISYGDVSNYLLKETEFEDDDQFYEIALADYSHNNSSSLEETQVIDYLINSEEMNTNEIENLINEQ